MSLTETLTQILRPRVIKRTLIAMLKLLHSKCRVGTMLGIKRHSSSEAETFVLWIMKETSRSKNGSVMLSLCAAELRGGFNMKEKYPELKENKVFQVCMGRMA